MDAIIQDLESTIKDFSQYIICLSPENLNPSKTVRWGPREVLSHLVFWHEQYFKIVSALIKGKTPKMLEGSYKDYNQLAVLLNKNESRKTLIKRLTKVQKEISQLCQNPDAEKIKLSFKFGGKVRPLPEALSKIAGHFRSHQRQLIKAGFKIKNS